MTRIALMGFGRLGRNIFRILMERDDFTLAAISDIADHAGLEYLLRYDTILGRFPHEVSIKEGHLYTLGKQINMLSGRDPGDINWRDHGVDVVIDATARSRPCAEHYKHIEAGARKVLLLAPPLDAPDKTVVMGLNHEEVTQEHKILSNSSITAHCTAPIVKIIDEAFGIERLFLTSIHAYTNDQRLADVPSSDLRTSRAAGENIIPTETGTADVLEDLFPTLADKISAMALKVPVPNGSLVDMVTFTNQPVTKTAINEVVRTAAKDLYPNLIEYTDDPIVSSDVKSSPYSTTFDALATQVLGDSLVKTVSWFDNGWGYAHRAIDLVAHLASKGAL
jgi:glyceraldehyde 3-phosphate dehydrogenase